jgi:hypothetical protein
VATPPRGPTQEQVVLCGLDGALVLVHSSGLSFCSNSTAIRAPLWSPGTATDRPDQGARPVLPYACIGGSRDQAAHPGRMCFVHSAEIPRVCPGRPALRVRSASCASESARFGFFFFSPLAGESSMCKRLKNIWEY